MNRRRARPESTAVTTSRENSSLRDDLALHLRQCPAAPQIIIDLMEAILAHRAWAASRKPRVEEREIRRLSNALRAAVGAIDSISAPAWQHFADRSRLSIGELIDSTRLDIDLKALRLMAARASAGAAAFLPPPRRVGPPIDETRRNLALMVGAVLRVHGVRLAKSRSGVLANVLSVVLAAEYPRAPQADSLLPLCRSIQGTLSNDTIETLRNALGACGPGISFNTARLSPYYGAYRTLT
jgi:hypothetical protein